MLTTVQSLRARGDPEERDVIITRQGADGWGNPFSVARFGMLRGPGKNALDLYRDWLDEQVRLANSFTTGGVEIQEWIRRLKDLARKRLLCACAPEAIRQGACHGIPLAMAIERLTGVGYELAPGTEED